MPRPVVAAPGPWQREYERDWRAYARRAIQSALGADVLDNAPSVAPSNERELRELLHAIGARPASRKRAHSLTPQRSDRSRGADANDSAFLLVDVSYVYRTPQGANAHCCCDEKVRHGAVQCANTSCPRRRRAGKEAAASSLSSVFPAFSSQDIEFAESVEGGEEPADAQECSPMEVLASQRLVARMADLSPIAGEFAPSPIQPTDTNVAASSSKSLCLITTLPVPGDEQQAPVVRDRPLTQKDEAAEDDAMDHDRTVPLMYHLDVSMQSMHLSDDERTVYQESVHLQENDQAETDLVEVQRKMPTSRKTSGGRRLSRSATRHDRPTNARNCHNDVIRSGHRVGGVAPVVSDAEPRVSKVLTFSDSDGDSDADVTVLEPKDQQQQKQEQQANSRTDSASSMSGAEPEPEFGAGFDDAVATSSPPRIDHPVPASRQVEQVDDNMGTDQQERHQVNSRTSDDQALEISDLTQPQPRSRRRRRLSQRPRPASSRSVTVTVGQQQQQEAPQPPQLMRTKLPLQVEYRFASDRKRRARRRRTLERTLGFPYQRPEYAVELQPHQNEAVQWMLDRERGSSSLPSEEALVSTATTPAGRRRRRQDAKVEEMASRIRGGILADEMGLGKTVCCIALICESLRISREACRLESEASDNPNIPRLRPPTLIITPLSILTQWEHELRSRTNLSVVTYQGSTRKSVRTADEFMGVDVVLSTYDTLRLKECKVGPSSSARNFDSDDDDDDEEEDEEMNGGGGTATAAPASNSGNPSSSTTPWLLAARLTPSTNRRRPRRRVKSTTSEVTSKLHQLAWHRVILDESHLITNASCARAQAAFSLKSSRRWCVTGTPVQNSSRDLASLVQFLGVSSSTSDLLGSASGDYDVDTTLRELVPHIMLRRLKNTVEPGSCTPILALPEKIEETRALEFATDVERALYLLLHRSTKRTVLQYLSAGASSRSTALSVRTTAKAPQFMHVFELLLRLRQTCDACALVTSDPRAEVETRARGLRGVGSGSGPDAPGCRNGVDECGTLTASETALLRNVCARSDGAERGGFPRGCEQLSTKVEALLSALREIKTRGEKALVVSQWTTFLDLIAQRLDLHNAYVTSKRTDEPRRAPSDETAITFDTLDGRLSSKERDVVVQSFQREWTLDVLLLSLRTGGLGLNLTAASHVFIMEPSWNPSLESQAVDRAHRFGQRRPVRVVRFLMKGTIEERVVALQRKKQRLAAALLGDPDLDDGRDGGAVNGGRGARLTRQDLRELFDTASE